MYHLASIRVGNTPLVPIKKLFPEIDLLAKEEWFNPFGSIKDRAAFWMIKEAIESGLLEGGNKVIIEPSSGNTGIALASIAVRAGLKAEIVIPEKVPEGTKRLLRSIGAEVLETPDDLCPKVGKGTDQCIAVAKSYVAFKPEKYFMPNQYENLANFRAHYNTTGPEIWSDTEGKVDVFIAGIGTGGTITGVAQYLKERNPRVKMIGVQPQPQHHVPGLRNLQESSMPKVLKEREELIDEWVTVNDEETFEMVRKIAILEGLYVGPSSGAVLAAISKLYDSLKGKKVVTIFADSGYKYRTLFLQMNTFSEEEIRKLEEKFKEYDPYTSRLATALGL